MYLQYNIAESMRYTAYPLWNYLKHKLKDDRVWLMPWLNGMATTSFFRGLIEPLTRHPITSSFLVDTRVCAQEVGTHLGAGLCSYGPMFLWAYVPMRLCSYAPVFLWAYKPMFLWTYVPMFPWACAPVRLWAYGYTDGPMFLWV